jgi:hypothetical protein
MQILGSLELLNTLYNELYLAKKQSDRKLLVDTEKLFDNLDTNGNIHLGLSALFFLSSAMLIHENVPIPSTYEQFKGSFKKKIREFCEVEGMVSLRWFKNYFLFQSDSPKYPSQILAILEELQRVLKKGESRMKGEPLKFPDILLEALVRWRNTTRFNSVFEAKKKKF